MERIVRNLSNQKRRQRRGIISMSVMVLLFFIVFYLNSNKTEEITFGFILGEEWKFINEWKIESKNGALLFIGLAIIGVLVSYRQFQRDKKLTLGVNIS